METKARDEVALTQKSPMSINSLSNGFFLVTSLSQQNERSLMHLIELPALGQVWESNILEHCSCTYRMNKTTNCGSAAITFGH